MSTYTEPTDLLLLEPAQLASHLRAVVESGMLTLAARYDEGSASRASANGGWSAKQVVGHLIDSAGNNIQRAVRLSIDSELRMPGYKQAEWVAVQGYQDRRWAELLSLWQMLNLHSRKPSSVLTRRTFPASGSWRRSHHTGVHAGRLYRSYEASS